MKDRNYKITAMIKPFSPHWWLRMAQICNTLYVIHGKQKHLDICKYCRLRADRILNINQN